MDDERITGLFFARDEAALSAASEKYGAALLRLARRLLGSREDAEEALNDTLLRAWNAIPPARPASLGAYLAGICRRAAFERLERRAAQKRSAELVELTAEMELCIPDPRSEAGADESELSESINRFLAELPAEQRVIFLRRYWFADSIAEASQRLGIGESKVKTTLFRLRKRLRKHLESEGFNVWTEKIC